MNDMLLLIEPLIPSLRRYARALMRDRATADDLVQDCLERAVSRWHQRRDDGDARTWMFAILHNLAVSHFRRVKVRGPHVNLSEVHESALGNSPAQEQQLLYKDVLEKLAELTEEQRSVLLLVAVEDVSYADAAKILDIPVGTVMSRLSRARERLQQLIEGVVKITPQSPAYLRSIK